MARERKPSGRSPLLPPVKRIDLSDKHVRIRTILIAISIVIALIALTYSLINLLNSNNGWQTVAAESPADSSFSLEISLMYNYNGMSTAERKKLSLLYNQASEDSYVAFSQLKHFEGTNNLYDVNKSIGKEIEISPDLYSALSMLEKYDSDLIYLAPVYQSYDDLFFADDDSVAKEFDPLQSTETANYFSKVLSFANNRNHIKLELLDANCVRLNVSDEYLAFAKDNDISVFVDLYWMRTAFALDYIAEKLSEEGFTRGYLSSVDGYYRSIDTSGESFSLNLFHKNSDNNMNYNTVSYNYPISLVTFSSYPMGEISSYTDRYYVWENGESSGPYIDSKDGVSRTSLPELFCVSKKLGCAETAIISSSLFISDSFDKGLMNEYVKKGIEYIWWDGSTFVSTDKNLEPKIK